MAPQEPRQGHCQSKDRTQAENFGLDQLNVGKVEQGMPDMSDSAWLAIENKTETQKSESTTDAKPAEHLQKDVANWLVTVAFSLVEETIHSNPDPDTAFNVTVQRRRA